MPPKFFEGLSNEDMDNIKAIAMRYCDCVTALVRPNLTSVIHDITVYHQNIEPLNLKVMTSGWHPKALVNCVNDARHQVRNNPTLKG